MSRDNRNKLWEMMDEGLIEPRTMAEMLLKWMSERDLGELIDFYGDELIFDEEEE
jgi:hypothetical protein